MSYEYFIYTEPSSVAFGAIAEALRKSHRGLVVGPDERSLCIPDPDGSGWDLIFISSESYGYLLASNLGPGLREMFQAIEKALRAQGLSCRIDDA